MPQHTRREVNEITLNIDEIIDGKFDAVCLTRQVLYRLYRIEHKMSALSDAVDQLVARVTEDTQHLRDLLAASQASEAAALANDAADAQTIADAQTARDAALADADATIARLNSIDPVSDFPAVEPPPEEPPA